MGAMQLALLWASAAAGAEIIPSCSSVVEGELVPAVTIDTPAALQGSYNATIPVIPGVLRVPGFTWHVDGTVNPEVDILVPNAFKGQNPRSADWCNNNGTKFFTISIYGICSFDGPDPAFKWYKVIGNSQFGTDCIGQRPGICRIIKVNTATGEYVESQDGPPTGGAMDFYGDKVKLHWGVCPSDIVTPSVAARKQQDWVPKCESVPAVFTQSIQASAIPPALMHSYVATAPVYPGYMSIPAFTYETAPQGFVNVSVVFDQDDVWKKLGNNYSLPWCNKKGRNTFPIYVYGLCSYDGPDADYDWYKGVLYTGLGNDCVGQLPGTCRLIKVGKKGTAAEGKYAESPDGLKNGGALRFVGENVEIHYETCPTTFDEEFVVATFTP